MAVVAGLPKNLDGDLNIKVDLTFTALFKYMFITKLVFITKTNLFSVNIYQSASHLNELFQL